MAVARILASPQFIYRIEEEPASLKAGEALRINDIDLASRLSFFLWSRGPDEALLTAARQGRLRIPSSSSSRCGGCCGIPTPGRCRRTSRASG